MDFSSSQIVRSCMNVSPNIKDYFDEERYLAEMDQPELLTPHLIEIMAVNLLLDELAVIGLETNQTAEEVVEYPTELNTIFDMRTAFDAEQLYSLLKAMPEKQFSEFTAIIEECQNSGDLLFDITDYFHIHFSTDERWENIRASAEHWWWSTDNFAKHINALVEKVERGSDPNKAVVDDKNIEDVAAFLLNFQQRLSQVKSFTDYIINSHEWPVDVNRLEKMVKDYDREKLDPSKLPVFAEYTEHPDRYKEEPQLVKEHHLHTNHHLEYWQHAGASSITREDLVMIVVSLFLDGLSREDIVKKLGYIVGKYLTGKTQELEFLKYLINLDFNTISSGVENAVVTE